MKKPIYSAPVVETTYLVVESGIAATNFNGSQIESATQDDCGVF